MRANRLFGVLLALALASRPGTLHAADRLIDFSEIRPGMKGYGLTVFSGTKPERFEVEAIAVLARFLPGQDLLLIRCSGHDMEKTGVVSGMSGSPIYFDGRMAGALSYGWSFAKDPIAGVTPIHSMLEDRTRAFPEPAREKQGLRRLTAPLMVSGFSPRLLKRLERRLGPLGLVPFQGATGGARDRSLTSASASTSVVQAPDPEPGGAIGVDLIRGDWSASAVGTITHVEGDRILAFGHPLFGLGTVDLPATGADVHTIFAGLDMSFKFASPLGALGSLVEDRQSCIVVRRGASPRMVPVTIGTHHSLTGLGRRFSLEVMDNPRVTPGLVLDVVANALDAAEGASDDLTADVTIRATLKGGRSLELRDRFVNSRSGAIDLQAFAPFLVLPDNSLDPARFTSLSADVRLSPGRKTAQILQAYGSVRRIRSGESMSVMVEVKPYGRPVERVSIPLRLPADLSPGRLSFEVRAGDQIPDEQGNPEDLDGLLRTISARGHSTDVVVSYEEPAEALRHRSFYIARAPGSLSAILGGRQDRSQGHFRKETEWILSGEARTEIEIVEPAVAR